MYLLRELDLLPFMLLLLIWALGGWLMTLRWFDLYPHERGLVGFALGMVVSNWLGNFLVRLIPMPAAFWVAALSTLALGVAAAWPWSREQAAQPSRPAWTVWLLFAGAAFIFTLIGRGLGLLDEYQNFPAISLMAAGDIPPHLPGAPEVRYGYHYFLFLLAVQLMRVGGAPLWTAVDLAHGITLALTMILVAFLAWRLTQHKTVAWVSALFFALAGGARWLLLLLPAGLLNRVSSAVTLIGSGRDTAPTLFEALSLPWEVAGAGPIPFPFAFVNGVNPATIMARHGYGLSAVLIVLLLLLLAERQQSWKAGIPLTILLASLTLANEVDFGLLYVGIVLVAVLWIVQNKALRPPESARFWIVVVFVAGILALVQGGMATEVLRARFAPTAGESNSYFQVVFSVGAPTVISSHLGRLSLLHPLQLLAALFEIGPLVIALPLVFHWGYDEFRAQRWIPAALVASLLPSMLSVFIMYSGNAGITATTRLLSNVFLLCKILALPLFWIWLREQADWKRQAVYAGGLIAVLGGLVLFAVQLIAVPRPVYSDFLTEMDARFYEKYWNRLPSSAWVLDVYSPRAITVFGRQAHTTAGAEWAVYTPEYMALLDNPDPYTLNAAGYGYVYGDKEFWKAYGATLDQPCVRVLDTIEGVKETRAGSIPDFRRLADVTQCK